jgi:hypothetical protein
MGINTKSIKEHNTVTNKIKHKMKRLLLIIILSMCLVSCDQESSSSADDKMTAIQGQMEQQALAQTGAPAIHNFQEKKLLKMIYELRDNEKIVNYAYLWNEFNGKLVYIGKCIGYGIPYSTQYSNPQKQVYKGGYNAGFGSLPQAEPNGLFMPSSSDGTWLMLTDSSGAPHPVYIEPKIIVSPIKLNL